MARWTLDEVNEQLAEVRAAIAATQESQEYGTGLGNRQRRADLDVLYRREAQLLDQREILLSGGAAAGLIRNNAVIRR